MSIAHKWNTTKKNVKRKEEETKKNLCRSHYFGLQTILLFISFVSCAHYMTFCSNWFSTFFSSRFFFLVLLSTCKTWFFIVDVEVEGFDLLSKPITFQLNRLFFVLSTKTLNRSVEGNVIVCVCVFFFSFLLSFIPIYTNSYQFIPLDRLIQCWRQRHRTKIRIAVAYSLPANDH